MLKPRELFRRIFWLGDWLDRRQAIKQQRHIIEKFLPLFNEARAKKDRKKVDSLREEKQLAIGKIMDPIRTRRSERLEAKARKYLIPVPPLVKYDEEALDEENWFQSDATNRVMMTDALEDRLKREVRDAQRARNDEVRKWSTFIFSFLGFILAITSLVISIVIKQKQADPCPRNY